MGEIIVQRQLQIRDELQRMLLALIDARRRAAPSEQPGDVLGINTRGEETHIGDSKQDEIDRLRKAEEAGRKKRH